MPQACDAIDRPPLLKTAACIGGEWVGGDGSR